MFDPLEIAQELVARTVASHGADVDLIAVYGSRAQGAAREDSDLDLFYVPREGADPPVARTFRLEGLLFDFWPIRWEMLRGFATGHLRGWAFAPALVHHARPIHVRTEGAAARLEEAKALILERLRPEARPRMLERAAEAFRELLADLGAVRLASRGNLADVRAAGWTMIRSTFECLALANQSFFDRGFAAACRQLERLAHRPPELATAIDAVAVSGDAGEIVLSCEAVAGGTDRLLRELRTATKTVSVREAFGRVYPELADMVRKLVDACARQERHAAGVEAWTLRAELHAFLARTDAGLELPDLAGPGAADLDELASRARETDRRLRRFLVEQGVDLGEIESLDEL
jgi:predicted nucleotidyltransferase